MGGGRLEIRSRKGVARGRRQRCRRVVNIRGEGHGRPKGFPIAVPEHTISLGDIGTKPEKRGLSLTKSEA